MKKRGWSLFLALVLCLSLLPATAWAEGDEGTGDTEAQTEKWADSADTKWYTEATEGTTEFTISTAAQLAGLAVLVNGTAEGYSSGVTFQGKTITLGDSINLSGKEWTPIGNSNTKQFQGTFDGQGNTVSKLYININNNSIIPARVGLFGYVGTSGKVQNLNVTGEVTASSGSSNGSVYTGGVVGDTNGATVENCSFSGTVKGESSSSGISYIGGVVGSADSTAVKNCSNAGTVTASTSNRASIYAGGVVGSASSATVENCYNTGTVSSTGGASVSQGAGGVVGYVSSGDVNNCYNTGNVSAQSVSAMSFAGGVVGDTNGATVRNCYNTGKVTASATDASGTSYAGGVAGRFFSKTEVSSCYNTGKVTATNTQAEVQKNFAGGITGYMESSNMGSESTGGSPTVTNCYFLKNENINAVLNGVGLNYNNQGTIKNVESKTAAAFASGEVAHLLQDGQEGTDTDAAPIWVQVKSTDGTYYPALSVLLSTEERAQICDVYKVTFTTDTTIEGFPVVKYAVAGGTVAEIPTAPEGSAWCVNNEEFTASTVVKGNLTVTAKTCQDAPTAAPELASRTTTSITLKEVEANGNNAAAQYGISTDGGTTWTWQDSPEFTGLTPNTEYTFALRYGATDSYAPSLPSDTVKISTDEQPSVVEPVDPVVPVVPPAVVTPTYPPVIEDTDHGTVSVTPANPRKGSTVTVTPKPETGYEVAGVTVTDRSGNPVAVTDNGDGTYSFTQPAGKVTISVAYVCDGQTDNCPSYHFADVDTSAWYHLAVDFVVENGLMNGYGNGSFGPNDTLTRAELAQILYNKEDRPSVSGSVFTDVADGAWYANAVNWANRNGIVTGYGSGKFGPGDPVTREQMATILYRYLAAKGYDVTARADLSAYADAGQISAYATDTMSWANAVSLLTGETPTTLVPQGNATRAQVATILMRFCESLEK